MTDARVQVLTAGGLANAALIVEAADKAGMPLESVAALIQKESGGWNVYGHDAGGTFSTRDGPVTIGGVVYLRGSNIEVTPSNFAEFLRRVRAGEKSNGVGPAQITYRGYFTDPRYRDYPYADPAANIRFGATLLADTLNGDFSDAAVRRAGAIYNGGASNPNWAYGDDLVAKTRLWRDRLASIPADPQPQKPETPSMDYIFHTDRDSPNYNPGVVKLPAKRCVLHWWGTPSGQDPWGVVAWLCNPAAQVSAHAVVWPGNVVCLVPYDGRSWANGNDEANNTSITLECDPNRITATIPTIVAYLADLVRQDVLHPDFVLSGHKDWHNTACPGDYYPRLASIRDAVRAALAGTPTPTPTPKPAPTPTNTEAPMTDDILREISAKLTAIYDTLTPGREGVKEAGATYLAITQPAAPLDLAAVTEAVARGVAAALTNTQGA